MSTMIIPFEADKLPSYLADTSLLDINKEVVRATGFPVLSIKGKVFTLVEDGVKRVLTKPDDPDEVAQSIAVVAIRANMNSKVYYAKKYAEGDSENDRPDCYSLDGVAPSPNATNPQAKKCALCPHNQWGSRVGDSEGKGKACQDNARLAVSAADEVKPMLLRVPPASLKPLREALKLVASRKLPYNAVILKVGFDREAPAPKLTFKPIGLLDDKTYAAVREAYDSEVVRAIVGLDDMPAPAQVQALPKPEADDADELDAALAARAKEAAAPAVSAEKPAAKAKKTATKEPSPTADDTGREDKLLADLDALLGESDD